MSLLSKLKNGLKFVLMSMGISSPEKKRPVTKPRD